MSKIAIIGAGNMGGAIARGLLKSALGKASQVSVSCPDKAQLDALKAAFPAVEITTCNAEAVKDAALVVLCVKPWLAEPVVKEILPVLGEKTVFASVVNALTLDQMGALLGDSSRAVVRLVPNIAAEVGKSITFLCYRGVSEADLPMVKQLAGSIGSVMEVEERLLKACTALASCGIAYVMRYIHASMQGAVELGLYPRQAEEIMLRTMEGAIAMLESSGKHPEETIDRVTTPAGITIRGLNAMEEKGFTTAVIAGLLKSAE